MSNKKSSNKAVAVGVAGAAIGAAVLAGAAILSDKNNRKKIGNVANDMKDQATEYIKSQKNSKEIKKHTGEVKSKAKEISKTEQKSEEKGAK